MFVHQSVGWSVGLSEARIFGPPKKGKNEISDEAGSDKTSHNVFCVYELVT